jgi:hypothetical protein
MHLDLRLIMWKRLINIPVRLLDKILKYPTNPRSPQTLAIMNYADAFDRVYRLEVYCKTFGKKPDGNFQRLLSVSSKLLANLSEDDPYYRLWIGLALWMAPKEYEKIKLTPKEVKFCFTGQGPDQQDDIPDDIIASAPEDFTEMALCGHLSNLVEISYKNKNRRIKERYE